MTYSVKLKLLTQLPRKLFKIHFLEQRGGGYRLHQTLLCTLLASLLYFTQILIQEGNFSYKGLTSFINKIFSKMCRLGPNQNFALPFVCNSAPFNLFLVPFCISFQWRPGQVFRSPPLLLPLRPTTVPIKPNLHLIPPTYIPPHYLKNP